MRDTVLATAVAGMMTGAAPAGAGRLHVACNQYPWGAFYAREKKDFNALLDAGLAEVEASGNRWIRAGSGGAAADRADGAAAEETRAGDAVAVRQ